jgi:release factor glutamine methyltransferase
MSTLSDYLRDIEKRLSAAGIDNPKLDAQLLVGHVLTLDRTQMFAQAQRMLSADEIKHIDALIERRLKHEPVARIIGEREFWGLPFGLNEATLEPRPDSETLTEAALKHAKNAARILDLGTGTGCLLLSLLHELPNATGLGIDIAPRAVEQAQKNAERLELDDRAIFKTSNWLEGITGRFDLIISNPPYIPANDIPNLMPDVREFDPRAALDGGKDGLDVYRLLIPQLSNFLNPEGLVIFEVGQGQVQRVSEMFKSAGFQNVSIRNDLGGTARCVAASF